MHRVLILALLAALPACGSDDEAEKLPHEVCEEVEGQPPCCMPPDLSDCPKDMLLERPSVTSCGVENVSWNAETGAIDSYVVGEPGSQVAVACSEETGRMTGVREMVETAGGPRPCPTMCWSATGEPVECTDFAACPTPDWPPED